MRKVFHLLLIGVVAAVFSGCFGSGGDVLVLNIGSNDGSVPPQFYSEAALMITPIYEDRTLSLEYKLVYPNRTEETLDEDIDAAGIVGGENFDRFEEIVQLIKDSDYSNELSESVGGGNLTVDLELINGDTRNFDVDWNNDSPGLEEIRTFYFDLNNLLTEEAPV